MPRPFEKGNPGGPGRPKQKPFLDWCKKWTVEKAELYLAPIAEDRRSKNQLEAIKTIMAYGVGKPVETQILDAEIAAKSGSSVEELNSLASDLLGGEAITSPRVDEAVKVDPGV